VAFLQLYQKTPLQLQSKIINPSNSLPFILNDDRFVAFLTILTEDATKELPDIT
jgi:hypothetical protein